MKYWFVPATKKDETSMIFKPNKNGEVFKTPENALARKRWDDSSHSDWAIHAFLNSQVPNSGDELIAFENNKDETGKILATKP